MSGYVPGEGIAVVAPHATVLLPGDAAPRLVRAVHAALVPGAGVPEVLQVLTGEFAQSLTRIPPFAVAVRSAAGVHAVARGAAEVRVVGHETVSGEGVSTWTERFFAGADAADLVARPGVELADDDLWPLLAGVVRAVAVRVEASETDATSGAAVPRAGTAARRESTEVASLAEATPNLDEVTPSLAEATPSEPGPAKVAPSEPGPAGVAPIEPSPETSDPSPAVHEPDPDASAGGASEETIVPAETVVPEDDDSFDHLWGSTILRPVEAAAIRPDERDPDDDPAPAPRAPAASAPVAVPPEAPAVAPALAPPEPSAPPQPASPATQPASSDADERPAAGPSWVPPFTIEVPEAPVERLGDHDGHTVVRGQPAVVAPAPIPEPARTTARAVGSTGEEIPLDRPVVLGRKPRVSRVGSGAVPRLVAVPSPEQDISRSHLEIRPEGASVLVVDLGSTNGTTLLRPGQLPVRLHPNEAVLVVEGDTVDLGEGVTVTFEGLS